MTETRQQTMTEPGCELFDAYEHRMPDDEVCPLSGEPIEVAADQPPRPVVRGRLRMVPPAPSGGWEKQVGNGGSSSVYAILEGRSLQAEPDRAAPLGVEEDPRLLPGGHHRDL
ncbi:hypothetical protein [Streptomyces sp. NPDC002845]